MAGKSATRLGPGRLMAMRRSTIAVALILVACAREAPDQDQPVENLAARGEEQDVASSLAPTDPSGPEPASNPASTKAAIAVLRDYFRLIRDRKFAEAHRFWSTNPGDTDLSDGAFAESFSRYRTYQAEIAAPGRIEGAAGSLYVQVPVTVTGILKNGDPFRLEGPVTLRRANDVPGATAEQLQWRIARSALKPQPVQVTDRFVGRWATELRNCRSLAWRFSATSLRTPAGSVCSFSKVTEVPGGYDIAARCTAEGPPADDTLRLRFAESAKALLFESNSIADAGLLRCD